VFSLRQGLTTIIVIGRVQAAIDIMEKEGAATVDRPHNISAGDTLSGGMRVLLTPAGERFKKMRRYVVLYYQVTFSEPYPINSALHTHLQPKIIANYSPTIMRKARQHILDIVEHPERHQDHAKRSVSILFPSSVAQPDYNLDTQRLSSCQSATGRNQSRTKIQTSKP